MTEVTSEVTGTPVAETELDVLRRQVAQLMSQQTATPVAAPDNFIKADGYDDTDDEPMIVFTAPDGVRHRVKVSEWSAYEKANNL